MAIEIERKFLVKNNIWRSLATGCLYRQGYLPSQNLTTIRVRTVGDRGYLTIKGKNMGMSRLEFEYEIPLTDANELLENLCQTPLIEKYRYCIAWGNHTWEVDEFLGQNQGLIVAEVELKHETEAIAIPDWIGQEVTGDRRYYNVNLAKIPYSQWE
ncbi:MAG: CYTH domain-containing protein [Synechocystis sp.]|jgi:CYTH domain-containing protein